MQAKKKLSSSEAQIEKIAALAALMTEHDLEEIDWKKGPPEGPTETITLKRATPGMAVAAAAPVLAVAPQPAEVPQVAEVVQVAPVAQESVVEDAPAPDVDVVADVVTITSPMVGVFYTSASPGDPSLVEVGQSVAVGDALCIIEAMKLMNEIIAEQDGVITEICAANGELVEFDQPLFKLKAL